MKYIFCISFILFCFCSSQKQGGDIEIEQINSNYPIILRGDISMKKIYRIHFPLVFNIKKITSNDIRIYSSKYNERGKYRTDYHKGWWSNSALIHVLNNKNQLEVPKNKDERELLSKSKMQEYVFYTTHTPDTAQHVQAIFKPYLEKMLLMNKDTIYIESIQELKKTNPTFLEGFLGGDSICINYTKEEGRRLDCIYLPVEIK